MPGKRLGALLWLALAAPALAAGQLEVRTEPPGAHVYLNNRHAGRSPVVIEAPAG
ncbi:MAG: PEGA domain-containing protein, partial [Candidatus Sericytochromatia bacterium]